MLEESINEQRIARHRGDLKVPSLIEGETLAVSVSPGYLAYLSNKITEIKDSSLYFRSRRSACYSCPDEPRECHTYGSSARQPYVLVSLYTPQNYNRPSMKMNSTPPKCCKNVEITFLSAKIKNFYFLICLGDASVRKAHETLTHGLADSNSSEFLLLLRQSLCSGQGNSLSAHQLISGGP